jgi:hypothetical protein
LAVGVVAREPVSACHFPASREFSMKIGGTLEIQSRDIAELGHSSS